MKIKIIISIVIGLAVLGFGTYGYFKATPETEEQAESNPKIEITPSFFGFGEIKYGEIAKNTFTVKNLGDKTLEIKKIATSCGCTTAEIGSENIAPQETAELKVTYDTGAMSGSHATGQQERIIYIRSNDPVNPQAEITIDAYVN